ncbi:MAG: thiamine pyrophosphate-binding protein [Candidatus Bathyarchaeia archaeon]
MRGCEILVKSLQSYDVKYVFGLPGDTSVTLYDAFREAEPHIHHVMTRDERNAAFMADAYARVAYKPGVCDAPSGGGALYMVPGVSEANNSSIPVLALTTDVALPDMERGTLTELDQVALFRSITKWSTMVERASLIPRVVRRAFREATVGRPGAVHIALPSDVLGEEVTEENVRIYSEDACKEFPAYRVCPSRESVREAVRLLLSADKLVIIVGGGAMISKAWNEVRELAETIVAPVATTLTGKGIIPEDHPLSIGVIGDNGGKEYANDIVRDADLVMFVGCKTGSVSTIKWTLLDEGKKIIHVDIDPREIGKNYRTHVGVVGDAKLSLKAIIDAVKEKTKGEDSKRIQEIRRKAEEWWREAEAMMDSPSEMIRPQIVIKELQNALPSGSTLVVDAGTPTPYVAAYYKVLEPGRRVVMARAHGEIGYALPGVVGAKLADPKRNAFALCGDGSFVIALGELETISRLGAPLTIVVFNNGCYSWIKTLQHIYCEKRYYEVDFADVDYCKIAEGFKLVGKRVEDRKDLEKAFREALKSETPMVIDIPVVPMHVELPPIESWIRLTRKQTA